MKRFWNSLRDLNDQQLIELAKLFLDIGKAVFLGSVAAFFIPTLVNASVSVGTLVIGLLSSLTCIIIGIILLKNER